MILRSEHGFSERLARSAHSFSDWMLKSAKSFAQLVVRAFIFVSVMVMSMETRTIARMFGHASLLRDLIAASIPAALFSGAITMLSLHWGLLPNVRRVVVTRLAGLFAIAASLQVDKGHGPDDVIPTEWHGTVFALGIGAFILSIVWARAARLERQTTTPQRSFTRSAEAFAPALWIACVCIALWWTVNLSLHALLALRDQGLAWEAFVFVRIGGALLFASVITLLLAQLQFASIRRVTLLQAWGSWFLYGLTLSHCITFSLDRPTLAPAWVDYGLLLCLAVGIFGWHQFGPDGKRRLAKAARLERQGVGGP